MIEASWRTPDLISLSPPRMGVGKSVPIVGRVSEDGTHVEVDEMGQERSTWPAHEEIE
jgi:hypothetical protein